MAPSSWNIVKGLTFYALLVAAGKNSPNARGHALVELIHIEYTGTAAAIAMFPSILFIFFHSVSVNVK
jgi:predicted acyltransferase